MSRGAPRGRGVAALAMLSLIVSGVPAHAQDDPTVMDPLDGEVPSSATEIADSISPVEPQVEPLEIPEPRSLRQEVEEGDQTTLVIATDVLFAFDSAALSPRAEQAVRDLAADVDDADGSLLVVGHTDSIGTDEYNQDLSERRAAAVADVLGDALGGDVELTTVGRGEDEPVADEGEGDPAAAARNRRVEIVFER